MENCGSSGKDNASAQKRVSDSSDTGLPASIVNSQTLEEVARLEQALKSGQLPADLEIIDTDPVTVDTNTNVDKMIMESEKEAKDGTSDVNEQKIMGLQTWRSDVCSFCPGSRMDYNTGSNKA